MPLDHVRRRGSRGVPIGSVYQYFPDKASILRELALWFMERTRGMLAEGLGGGSRTG